MSMNRIMQTALFIEAGRCSSLDGFLGRVEEVYRHLDAKFQWSPTRHIGATDVDEYRDVAR
jgi:hypothetical protein